MTVINMQSKPANFGPCYECERGFHQHCIGVPCQCDCPDMGVEEAYERLCALQNHEAFTAGYMGEDVTASLKLKAQPVGDTEGKVAGRATTAAHHALNAIAIRVFIDELRRLHRLINTPEVHDFTKAVVLESAHQRERWGAEHDEKKTAEDWFWLIGYLAGKALRPDQPDEKRLHRIITVAAAAANWHAAAKATEPRRA